MLDSEQFANWFYDSFGDKKYELVQSPDATIDWMPDYWRVCLENPSALNTVVASHWNRMGFRNSSAIIRDKLSGVKVILEKPSSNYMLAYFFQINGGLYAFGGGPNVSLENSGLPAEISSAINPLYTLHNGFLDLGDGQSGWREIGLLQLEYEKTLDQSPSLLNIFQIGSNSAAIEYGNTTEPKHLLIWASDEEVEEVEDIIEEIDEWIAEQIEEFDDAESPPST